MGEDGGGKKPSMTWWAISGQEVPNDSHEESG